MRYRVWELGITKMSKECVLKSFNSIKKDKTRSMGNSNVKQKVTCYQKGSGKALDGVKICLHCYVTLLICRMEVIIVLTSESCED